MKLSDYFTNILSAIFTPISNDFNKERGNIYTSLIKSNNDVIKAQEKIIKDFNISYNTLFKKYSSVISENHRLNEINTVLNNKLQRYYKTGKKLKKK